MKTPLSPTGYGIKQAEKKATNGAKRHMTRPTLGLPYSLAGRQGATRIEIGSAAQGATSDFFSRGGELAPHVAGKKRRKRMLAPLREKAGFVVRARGRGGSQADMRGKGGLGFEGIADWAGSDGVVAKGTPQARHRANGRLQGQAEGRRCSGLRKGRRADPLWRDRYASSRRERFGGGNGCSIGLLHRGDAPAAGGARRFRPVGYRRLWTDHRRGAGVGMIRDRGRMVSSITDATRR